MAAPNRWLNTILYALIGGFAISLLSAASSVLILKIPLLEWFGSQNSWVWLLLTFLLPSVVIFILLGIAFQSFSKLNISHLYNLVPDLNPQNAAKDFEGLSEQISSLS